MRSIPIAVLTAALAVSAAQAAAAQQWLGYAALSVNSDLNDQRFPGIAGGVLVDVARSWVSVGGQGDMFFSGGYVAGRGGPIAQINVLGRSPVRAFVLGGYAWGEQAGPMIGAGVDIGKGRVRFRVSVQDYLARVNGFDCALMGLEQAYCDANFHGGRSYTGHQPSVQVGIVWR
jgi:opacity protein-like surface antigen